MYAFMFKYQTLAWIMCALMTGLLIGLMLGDYLNGLAESMPTIRPFVEQLFA